jgi:Flp pilus assembly protein TadD
MALGKKGDSDGAIAEEREALRLNPDNDAAHNNLGLALGKKGDGTERSLSTAKPCA